MESMFKKVTAHVEGLGDQIESAFGSGKKEEAEADTTSNKPQSSTQNANRFGSFAPEVSGAAKWFVDGASYFWAVSEALERAQESIMILDWWLSPELYLRRPPSKYGRYRLDLMLKAAAERGVKVYVIVYKEVQAALTLDSAHTRTALEALHPNVKVFRHPDHLPTGYDLTAELGKSLKALTQFDLARASGDAIKAVYGTGDGIVLYWAHHEKLLVIDRKLAFMGGLDMCFGRWDTSSHPISDVKPGGLSYVVFPGQDYNNARVYDFADVKDWEKNQLDRTKSSRMGWSDVALSMNGKIVHNLVDHFVDRWNFIFGEKYKKKNPGKYSKLEVTSRGAEGHRGRHEHGYEEYIGGLTDQFNRLSNFISHDSDDRHHERRQHDDETPRIQLVRSCSEWSAGHPTERSIQNAYIHAIEAAEHFVYIENQFFITATDSTTRVKNQIGAAIVSRIVRAFNKGQRFKVIILMPAVPAFAGDLKSEGALGTRAIMEFQYASISRGRSSILEKLKAAGIRDPGRYIGFYNLRSFDRINTSRTMSEAEAQAGVLYEDARREYEGHIDRPLNRGYRENTEHYDRYRREAARVKDTTLDTISSAYMDGGPRVADLTWDGNPEDEINAYVSEQLYIHTKLLIADDRVVICGSANLNDRSQLGNHDSEIAVVIEDPAMVDSVMDGQRYQVSRFAASLRRYIFRKHLGLIPDQLPDRPDSNWTPVDVSPNHYDWGSAPDRLVVDPLSSNFQSLWNRTAQSNTEIFSRAFHPVPNDRVRTWKAYDEFFSSHFIIPSQESAKKEKKDEPNKGKVEYGHIVQEEFPGGIREVKEWLGRIRGTLVEMPLDFLVDVDDIAKEGLSLNSLTDELYT
ncbi:putative phospholipase D [Dactylonectria macrodidyma]|uniref:Phospholipase n=1 Tax=Dactylonectria macrodidyma TaxID=307937 RepID=A0A9P9JJ55_9HYPO|nr:putative phospholipase D [Dactylonectria macrodidyma]